MSRRHRNARPRPAPPSGRAPGSAAGRIVAGFEVRPVQPYQALKPYRCPGCDHEVVAGQGHVVAVPIGDAEARRHWHSSCWHREEKRLTR
ncbi:MAG: hypothetical protein WCI50_14535 [Actinomycetes bacterium]